MDLMQWFQPPRVVLTLFISLMAVCALALGWLGWQVVVQDRAVEAQRRQEQVERAADRVVAAMVRTLATPDVTITMAAGGDDDVTPAGRLAYMPEHATARAVPENFAEAEALEFSRQGRSRAADAYRRLAESSDTQSRAEALMRLARVLRHQQKWAEALRVYASLEKLGEAPVAAMPAGLVARAARCSVLAESGDGAAARREAAAVWADLTDGKWRITRATLETYLSELNALAPDLVLPSDWEERMTRAAAAEWAFDRQTPNGQSALNIDGQVVSVSWERQAGVWKIQLTGPVVWRALWANLERDTSTVLRVSDAEGRVVHGGGPTHGQVAYRAAEATGLPWSLTATEAADAAPSQSWTARRRLLVAGLLVFALIVGAGSSLIARAMGREFAVSRLQADFVAAVSHELRTPLTAIRQLTEMLARGRMENEPDKQRAYELMLGESDRLSRLVESLLDFGRMQAHAYTFRPEKLEAIQWTRSVATEFQETVRNKGYVIEFTAPPEDACLDGDREALGGALWNLLDNAVKYSPNARQVHVAVSRDHGNVEISVRDHGSGIASEDLRRVFGKFYRGANAKTQGTRGTGIGLALVKEIVDAHGGLVRVNSELGHGSKFTIVLPCRES
jgi:signal transduction histidine kinase